MINDISKLGIGTVQWGMRYGLSNKKATLETIRNILFYANRLKIDTLDTASVYGESEKLLGLNDLESFNIITKTPQFGVQNISQNEVYQLNKAFFNSLKMLKCNSIHSLLVHNINDILLPGGDAIILAMRKLKEEGYVNKIGISVYDSKQIDLIIKKFIPDLIQLPLNVLDQRMQISGHLEMLKKSGVEIHVRSVFLQGLLLMPIEKIPKYFDPIRPTILRWHKAANLYGLTLSQAALIFIRDNPYVDKMIIGFDDLAQFKVCTKDFLTKSSFDAKNLDCKDHKFLNPSNWKL
ncbi:aldo/keto reductase [Amylibacter sp.]|nr:aldo/keto reductase [Amylibacter sp.]